ncbi:hypothetical protein CK203_050285 [Vitis vinifera]|uniref:Uncharacterized protein n=1 Tax=Vitis vinifera TaxID=29760 RepID=A0A438GZD0_VITVI|nr:hypothetical protein CK203_050285 [Vitis vinifera]
MEPKKSETSQDLAGKSGIGLKSGPLTGKSEIGTLAGKSEIGFLAGKSENIGTFEIASKSGALTRSEIDLQPRLARLE